MHIWAQMTSLGLFSVFPGYKNVCIVAFSKVNYKTENTGDGMFSQWDATQYINIETIIGDIKWHSNMGSTYLGEYHIGQ